MYSEIIQTGFVYITISVIVSIDVFALTLGISKTQLVSPKHQSQWCRLNGFFHAALLFMYLVIFTIFVEYGEPVLVWMADLISLFEIPFLDLITILLRGLGQHFQTIFGIGALVWIWVAYSKKIVEVPQVSKRSDINRSSNMLFLPIFFILRVTRIIDKNDHSIDAEQWAVQAFIVAVDMLALAALVKSMPIVDSWLKISMLIVTVYLVVYWMARLAANLGNRWFSVDGLSKESRISIKVLLRLLEPLLIFYFSVELMVFIINGQNISSPVYFLASGFLVGGIIARHGFDKIVSSAIADQRIENA